MRKPKPGRSAVLPLGIKNRLATELPALVALSAIGEPWFCGAHQADLLAVALVVGEMAPQDSPQALCAAELRRLCERPVTRDDKTEVACHLAACLPWLQVQQNHRVERAVRTVAAKHLALAA